jgi:hypothetical protein
MGALFLKIYGPLDVQGIKREIQASSWKLFTRLHHMWGKG